MTASGGALADPQFTLVDLGTMQGTTSQGEAINNSGQITGIAPTAAGDDRAFRTSAYSAINPSTDDLGLLTGGTYSRGYAINSSGTVAGEADAAQGDRAFQYAGSGPMQNLGTLGGDWSYAFGINDAGEVIGSSAVVPGPYSATSAFLFNAGHMYNLGTLGPPADNAINSYAYAVNSAGSVIGYSEFDSAQPWLDHAFLWTPSMPNGVSGTMADIGTLGGSYSYAWAINDKNQIVGGSFLQGDVLYHAYRYLNGARIDLGTLGGQTSEAFGINSAGQIVGNAEDAAGTQRAFLFANGTLYDLNTVIQGASGWFLQDATAINSSGDIVGYGTDPAGDVHGFLLVPLTHDSAWNVDADGTWSNSANWLNGTPNAIGAAANFGDVISAPRTVTLDSSPVVARLSFDSLHSYTLSGSGAITMQAGEGNATISDLSGSHAIAAALVLNSDTSIGVLAPNQTLTVSGSISSSAASLICSGSGTVILSGNNTYTGSTVAAGGTLSVGSSSNLGDAANSIVFRGGTIFTTGSIISPGRNVTCGDEGGIWDSNGFDSALGNVDGTGGLEKRSAGLLTVEHVRLSTLAIDAGGVRIADSNAVGGVSAINALTLGAGATLDLRNNSLVDHTQPLGTWNGAGYTGVTGMVQSGRSGGNAGLWSGSGIITTMPEALSGNLTTLGVAAASDILGIDTTATAIWNGQTVSGSDVLVMYTYGGDANLDGKINIDDYGRIDANVGKSGSVFGWSSGDFNYDGKINIDDYGIIDSSISSQGPSLSPSAGSPAIDRAGVSVVPEPWSIGCALIFACISPRRRRRDLRSITQP